MPKRSKKVIFLPFCSLCQASKARGLVRERGSVLAPLISLLIEKDVNIVQLPCPEMRGEGLKREPRDISYYEREDFSAMCREMAREQAGMIGDFLRAGFFIVAVVGVRRSPSCSPDTVKKNGEIVSGKGVFMGRLLEQLGGDTHTLSIDYKDVRGSVAEVRRRIEEMKGGRTSACKTRKA